MNSNGNSQLQRKLSPLNVWTLALGCIIGWGAFVMPGNVFLGHAGTLGTLIGIVIAIFVMIIIAFNYQFMILHNQSAGGEFAYAKMIFGKTHGFICAWFLTLSYLTIVPLNATALSLISRNLLNNVFEVGFHYVVAGYDIYVGEIAIAILSLIIFAIFSIYNVKATGIVQNVLTFMLLGGVTVISIVAALSPVSSINNLYPLLPVNDNPLIGILTIVAIAPWAFVGFDTIPQAAEEFNFSVSKTRFLMIVAIIFGGMIYIILNTITAAVVPNGYVNYLDYIKAVPNLHGLTSLPTFYAAYVLMGNAGLIVIGIAVLGAILSGINGFYMATSRLLYSLSREGVIPTWFGVIHETNKTPKNAILFVMLISCVAPFFGRNALLWIVDMSSIGAAIGYGYTSAAALIVAKREGNLSILITGVLGVIFACVFAILLLVPIDMFNCSLGKESYFCLVIWMILGLVFYKFRPNF